MNTTYKTRLFIIGQVEMTNSDILSKVIQIKADTKDNDTKYIAQCAINKAETENNYRACADFLRACL